MERLNTIPLPVLSVAVASAHAEDTGLESEQLYRLEVNGNEVTEEEALLDETLGPVRDVRQGPDGYLYVLVGDENGTLYRLETEK